MDRIDRPMDNIIFQFMDECKMLFFPEQWNKTFMDYSKNEIFTLLFVYRKEVVTMSDIAEYLGVPLNTVTGIVSRLEKKNAMIRERDKDDKRIVLARMNDEGKQFVEGQLSLLEQIVGILTEGLNMQEMELLMKIISKVPQMLAKGKVRQEPQENMDKKIRRIMIE